MNFAEIGKFILEVLNQYGIVGSIIILLTILVFKFADQLIKLLTEKALKGQHIFTSFSRKQRKESIFKINRLLTELINKIQADRAAIFEYHNGGYNLTGLPFLHFSLSVQRNRLGVDELSKDFDNVLVSAVPDFIEQLNRTDICYMEDVSDLKDTFPRLYRELDEDQIKSVVFCNLEGVDDEVGFLMLAFKSPKPVLNKRKIQRELFKKAQKISSYLDYKHLK